ncbi:unnamed protein product [Bursaphelenchus xylophilus]|uniref:(pine wood nematode) hypothetical protein n=1 Tax=Bursaphelenchus xylophilus TaxID=6326 RepID=A0A1I7S5K2_BURXY|nr:unnamed protein product [Bursaphelenchus xylophilus]CAG9124800.1 unnamed protein product [Bursaphelenchus xylophilus]
MRYCTLRLLVLGIVIGTALSETINLTVKKWYYAARSEFGTPSQVLWLGLDIGTRDLWVYGGMCYQISTKCTKGTLQYYRGHSSSTYTTGAVGVKLNLTTSYYSGNGTVTLVSARDTISIAGHSLGSTNFGESKLADYSFYKTLNTSGLFGLGLGSVTALTGYFSTLIGNGTSYTLTTHHANQTATITTGEDPNCVQPFHYIPLSITTLTIGNRWEIPLISYKFGSIAGGAVSGHTASFTTLSKNIQIPVALYQPIHDELVRLYYDFSWAHDLIDCKRRAQLPDLTLNLGGKNYTVTPHQYITQTASNYCILRLVANYASNQWILGYPFHQGHCENFDPIGLRVGLSTPNS